MLFRSAVALREGKLAMSSSQLAFAQGNSNYDRDRHDNGRNDRNGDYRHDNRDFGRSHNEHRKHGRGVGPNHEYYQGDRMPYDYRHRHYVVHDWRGHHLSAPRRGQQWVQSGGDYVLIAIATGVIIQVQLGS